MLNDEKFKFERSSKFAFGTFAQAGVAIKLATQTLSRGGRIVAIGAHGAKTGGKASALTLGKIVPVASIAISTACIIHTWATDNETLKKI